VAIASSEDPELGGLAAPLDASLTTEQVRAIVWRALDLDESDRNLRAIARPGTWVAIKPNMVTSRSNRQSAYWYEGKEHKGQNTDVRVVAALVEYLIEKCQPKRISIAEGGAEWQKIGESDTDAAVREDGWTVRWPEYDNLSYADLVDRWARTNPGLVDIVDLNYDERRFLPVPDPGGSGIGAFQRKGAEARPPDRYGRDSFVHGSGELRPGYYVPATVLDCDVFISVPAMKTHLVSATSIAIKNYVGISVPRMGPGIMRNSKGDLHKGDITRGFVDMLAYHPADYSVVEGFWGTDGNGPQWGDDVQHNIVLAGADPVAVDTITSSLMGYNPEDLNYLRLAAAKRLGEMCASHIDVVGRRWQEVSRHYPLGRGRSNHAYAGRGVRDWLVSFGESMIGGAAEIGEIQFESDDRFVDLTVVPESVGELVAHAISELECDVPVEVEAWFGSEGPAELRINGVIVATAGAEGEHSLGEAKVKVRLAAGLNRLEVSTTRSGGGFGFSLLLCGQPGCLPLGCHYVSTSEIAARLRSSAMMATSGSVAQR
jgi:uncharacterized protein (DUF362 family)